MDADARLALVAAAIAIEPAHFVNAVDHVSVRIVTARVLIGTVGTVPAEAWDRGWPTSCSCCGRGGREGNPQARGQVGLRVDGNGRAGLYEEIPAGGVEPLHQGFILRLGQETEVKDGAGPFDNVGRKGLGEQVVIAGFGLSVWHLGLLWKNHDVLAVICT